MTDLELPFLAVIPHAVLADQDLQPNAKLFYGCLVGLAKKEGYCWASNEQLAEMFGVKPRIVARWLEHLGKKGFISREVQNTPHLDQKKFFWKTERKIFVHDAFSRNVCEHVRKDMSGHVQKYMPIGDVQKDTVNSKSLNEQEKKCIKKFSKEKDVRGELKESLLYPAFQDTGNTDTDNKHPKEIPILRKKEIYKEIPSKNQQAGEERSFQLTITPEQMEELEDEFGKELVKVKVHALQLMFYNKARSYKRQAMTVKNWCMSENLKSNTKGKSGQTNLEFALEFAKKNPDWVETGKFYIGRDYFELNDGKMPLTLSFKDDTAQWQAQEWLKKAKIPYEI